MVKRSRTIALGYGDLNLGDAELEVVKSLRILGVILASKLTFETHLRKVVTKTSRSFGVKRQAGKIFDCPRAVSCMCLSSLEYCASVWKSLAESHWICWIVLLAVRKDYVKVSFVAWRTEGRLVPCVYSMRFITEWTIL